MVGDGDDTLLEVGLGDLEGCEVFGTFVDVEAFFAHEVGTQGVATLEKGEAWDGEGGGAATVGIAGGLDTVDPGAGAGDGTGVGAEDHEGEVGRGEVGIGLEFDLDSEVVLAAIELKQGAALVAAVGRKADEAGSAAGAGGGGWGGGGIGCGRDWQLGGLTGLGGQPVVVARDDIGRFTVGHDAAFVNPDGALAQGFDLEQGVGTENETDTLLFEGHDAVEGFAGKGGIADGECLVDDEQVGVDSGGYRKGEAHVHAAGVGAYGLVDEGADVGKLDDFVGALRDFVRLHAEGGGVEEDVFAAGELGVETCTEFKQGGDAPVDFQVAFIWVKGATEELEQRGFARAVLADDAE